MLCRSAVLGSYTIGVMPGHLDGRPAEPGLFLGFGDDAVDRGRVEMAKGVQVDVLGHAGFDSDAAERVAHGVRVWRLRAVTKGREDERLGVERDVRV